MGVTVDSSEDDIKKYYKRQAVLVHPDKNNQSGAEEAFKILIHAFNMIGDPVSCFYLRTALKKIFLFCVFINCILIFYIHRRNVNSMIVVLSTLKKITMN